MFSVTEYKALISCGVEQSTLAIVEGAYRVLFEAGGETGKHVKLYGMPYHKVAAAIGVDISGCTDDTGKLNARLVNSELLKSPIYRHADAKIAEIMNAAMRKSGWVYHDDSGSQKNNFPDVAKMPEFKAAIENIRTALMTTMLCNFGKGGDIEAFDRKLDSIGVDTAANTVNEVFLSRLMKNFMVLPYDKQIHGTEIATDANGNVDDTNGPKLGGINSTSDEVADSAPFKNELIMRNSDGTGWYGSDTIEYDISGTSFKVNTWLIPQSIPVEFGNIEMTDLFAYPVKFRLMNGEVDNIVVESLHGLNSSIRYNDAFHDLVSFICSDKCTTVHGTECYAASTNNEERLSVLFSTYCDIDDIVKILKADDKFNWDGYDMDMLFGEYGRPSLLFLIECHDKGLANADDFAEWALHAGDEEWLVAHVDNEILNRVHTFSGTVDDTDITPLMTALQVEPDGVIKAITGKSVHVSGRRVKGDGTVVSNFENLSTAEQQVNLCEHGKNPNALFKLLNAFSESHRKVYVPLTDAAYEEMMYSDTADPSAAALDIVEYYADISRELKNGKFTGDDVYHIMRDIKRFVTPAVQELAVADESMRSYAMDNIKRLAMSIPGFRTSEKLIGDSLHNAEMHAVRPELVTGKELLKTLRRMEHMWDGHPTRWCEHFIRGASVPHIVGAMKSHVPELDHLRDEMIRFLKHGQVNPMSFLFALGEFSRNADPNELCNFVETFIKPNKKYFQFVDKYDWSVELGDVLGAFEAVFNTNEKLAVDTFLGNDGLLSAGRVEYVASDATSGAKQKKVPTFVENPMMEYSLAGAIAKKVASGTVTPDAKWAAALIGNSIAGRHLIMKFGELGDNIAVTGSNSKYTFYTTVMAVSALYDGNMPVEIADQKRVISMDDFNQLLDTDEEAILYILDELPRDIAREVCSRCLNPEKLNTMARTESGLMILLRLSAKASMNLFVKQFVLGHSMAIEQVIKRLPPDEAGTIRDFMKNMTGNDSTFSAVAGSDRVAGEKRSYHEANGLKWMDGFVVNESIPAKTADGMYTLFTRDEAAKFADSISNTGWRLPTADELDNLGDNSKLISEKRLGFLPTGLMTGTGKVNYPGICFAWCVDSEANEIIGYSVNRNNIQVDDGDINADTDRLAIKLVR